MKDIFKYTGDAMLGEYYKSGRIYMLEVNGFRKPYIIAPVGVEYANWEEFFSQWERFCNCPKHITVKEEK